MSRWGHGAIRATVRIDHLGQEQEMVARMRHGRRRLLLPGGGGHEAALGLKESVITVRFHDALRVIEGFGPMQQLRPDGGTVTRLNHEAFSPLSSLDSDTLQCPEEQCSLSTRSNESQRQAPWIPLLLQRRRDWNSTTPDSSQELRGGFHTIAETLFKTSQARPGFDAGPGLRFVQI